MRGSLGVELHPLWGVGGFTGEILSTLAATGNSLKLVGLLFSICELLHSTYFRELVSIYGRRASL